MLRRLKSFKRTNLKIPLPLNQEIILRWLQEPLLAFAIEAVRKEEHVPGLMEALSNRENFQTPISLQKCKIEILSKCKEKNFFSKYNQIYKEIANNNQIIAAKYKIQLHIILLHSFMLNSFTEWTLIKTRLGKMDHAKHQIKYLKKNYPNAFKKYPRESSSETSLQIYIVKNVVTFKEKLEEEEFENITKWEKRRKTHKIKELKKRLDVFTHLQNLRTENLCKSETIKVLTFKKSFIAAVKNVEY